MVSSGLIMISQRLRGIDEDGNAIDGLAPKLKSAFGAVGVEIEDVNGNLRSTYDILSDYAKIQDTLTTKQKQYLGELAAGNRQVKVLNAIMQGWEDVEKATLQATDSSGSAMRENEIFASSLQGRINQFKTTFQELSTEIVNSDLLKFIVDLGTTAFGGLDKLIKSVGLLPTLIGGITIALSAMKKNAGISNVKYAHVA
jgi:TP901 family phage tail tape measure protein